MSEALHFLLRAEAKIEDPRHRAVLRKATGTWQFKVAETKSKYVNWALGRHTARDRKWDAINHLHSYLEEFELRAMAHGSVVHWAETGEEACEIVWALIQKHGIRKVVKSKSMVTEEIHLNTFLEARDVVSIETDLGEYIVQLRGEPPYHITSPAMHLTREDIAQTFHAAFGSSVDSTAEELAWTARQRLRNEYLTAGMGITGANFLIAETGSVSITENEGNARLCSSLPRIHVVIAGIEKILPKLADLGLFLPLLSVSGTGQPLTSYHTVLTGPRQATEPDGPEQMHIILLDNGRTRLLNDVEQREALHCIRCGACLNICPVYKNVGGHSYGTTYQGPIGSVITPHLKNVSEWSHLSFASSLCGSCSEVCPVHINIHHHLLENRRNVIQAGGVGVVEGLIFRIWVLVMTRASHYRGAMRVGRILQKLFKLLGLEQTALDPFRRWTRTRVFPALASESFREWWNGNRNSST